ncbi:cytochrome P450 [Aciditerrimonas ferrireducens]|uniref:Cytochrome P450 n=1 Tax=Aciditerrimonas ferrireducens TaxID=667306 RepID=A0ABV6C2P8_9ACTN
MTTTDLGLTEELGRLLVRPEAWADMDHWHAVVAEARRRAPVWPIEVEGFAPFLAVLAYRTLQQVSRDNQTWLNTPRSVLQPEAEYQAMLAAGIPEPRTLVHLDGQEHHLHRQVTAEWFKPQTVNARQPRIDAICQQFVQKMADLGDTCDFAQDIAQPFTLRVIMDIYGVPESDEALMLQLTQGLFGAGDPEYMLDPTDPHASLVASVTTFIEYFTALTEDRRRHPRDDLATVIANGQPGGQPMGEAERLWYYIIVATAGHDTTSFAMSGGLHQMLRQPEILPAIAEDPGRAVAAAEEALRLTSPVRHFLRYAATDTEVEGVPVRAGQRVLLSYPSANRDETVFPDPNRMDLERPNADRHLGFGIGAHFCLGAQFARRELRTMYARLAQDLAEIEPAGPVEWAQSNFVSGPKHLPVRYRFRPGRP